MITISVGISLSALLPKEVLPQMLPPTFNHTTALLGCIHQCCIHSDLSSGSMTGFFSPGPHLHLCEVCVVLPDSFMAYSLIPFSGFHCCSMFSAVSGLRQVSDVFFLLSFTAPHFLTSFLKGPSEPSPLHGIALWIGLWVQVSLSYFMFLGGSSDELLKRDKNYTKCRIRVMYPLFCWKQRGRWCPSFHKCCIWEFSVSQGYMLPPRNESPVVFWQLWTFPCSLWVLPKKMVWSMRKMFGFPSDFGCVSYSESVASQVLLCTSVFGVNTGIEFILRTSV